MLFRISPRLLFIACFIAGQLLVLVYYSKVRTDGRLVRETTRFENAVAMKNSNALMAKWWTTKDENSTKVTDHSKYFITFSYWEQFSMATSNLLSLTALSARTGRQVVIPYVNGSFFSGNERTGTLERYYNIDEFNNFLRSQGLATLVSLKMFQDACQNKLDLLLRFIFGNTHRKGPGFYPCLDQEDEFQGFKVGQTICIENKVSSIEMFADEVIKGFACVGIKVWRGHGGTARASFPLPSNLGKWKLHHYFNSSLVKIAQDFIAKNLGPEFISVHLRLERIRDNTKDLSYVEQCLSELSKKVQQAKGPSFPMGARKVFLAGDFSKFGSHSRRIIASRKLGVESVASIYVSKLNAMMFNPSHYKLSDPGSVAVVEMITLSSGKELFLLGGGSFQAWVKTQFMQKMSGDKGKIYETCT